MVCRRVPVPGGTAIVCGPGRRCKGCGSRATLECDWKVPTRKSGTCDAPICARCALHVGDDKDLCPAHAEAFGEWLKRREQPLQRNGAGTPDSADPTAYRSTD